MPAVTRKPYKGGRRPEADRNDVAVLAAARDVFIEQGWDAPDLRRCRTPEWEWAASIAATQASPTC